MFSGFYLALLFLLVFLIIRVVSFEWRGKSDSPRWRTVWTGANALGSFGASLIWGVAFANLVNGVPLSSSGDYVGSFWDLFSVYTVLGGVAVVLLFAFHGASYLALRTTGDLCERAMGTAKRLAVPAAVVAAIFLSWTVSVAVDHNDKDVFPPVLPAVGGIAALLFAVGLVFYGRHAWGFAMTAVGTVLLVGTIFTSLYPRVLVSSPNFANSLTVSNSASAHYTLVVLTVVALIVTPVVLVYQGWSYYVFRARVTGEEVEGPAALLAEHHVGSPSA